MRIRTSIDGVRVRSLTFRRSGTGARVRPAWEAADRLAPAIIAVAVIAAVMLVPATMPAVIMRKGNGGHSAAQRSHQTQRQRDFPDPHNNLPDLSCGYGCLSLAVP